MSPLLYPVVSIVDPRLQVHLPWYQQVNGFVDAMMHILEYLTNINEPEKAETTFAINISLLKSIIKCGDALQKNNEDYEARANFCWASTCALNGISSMGLPGMCCAVHWMEHAMGAIDPKVSHGAGLGVVFWAFTTVNGQMGLRHKQYDRIAREVFGLEGWEGLVKGWKEMLTRWGHPTTLKELFGKDDQQLRDELFTVCKLKPFSGYWPDCTIPDEVIRKTYALI